MRPAPLLLSLLIAASISGSSRGWAHTENPAALADLDALIADVPANAELRLRRAAIHEEAQAWALAEADLKVASQLVGDSAEISFARGRLALARDQPRAARDHLNTALRQSPQNLEALLLRARAEAQLGETLAAFADYSAVIAQLPEPRPELYLARAALSLAPNLAIAGLDEGIQRIGPSVVLIERAIELETQCGRIDAAARRFEQLASLSERPEIWLKRRGDLLARAGRADEGRAAYASALDALSKLPMWLRSSEESQRLAAELTELLAPPLSTDAGRG